MKGMSSTQDEVKKQTNPEKLYTYPTEDFVHSKILEYIPVLKGPTIPLWVTIFQEQRIMTEHSKINVCFQSWPDS